MTKILLVEDETELADVVMECSKAQVYLVDRIANGAKALDRLKFFDSDIIELDRQFPGLSVIQV
ncbi:MAG: hypothetical protein K2X93_11010 [Candidatus Obscuribacterales bacterium]|nr:hypothetical protein [Candidatus Obscuribacterales bacterium]